jgi:hypothetical protein
MPFGRRLAFVSLGLILFASAVDCQSAFARGGHRGGHRYGRGYGGYGGYGGGYGYGNSGNYQQQRQDQAWNQAHEHPLSLGPYSSVPRSITPANQSYVVREYSWPSSSQLANTARPSQLAGKSDLTR